MKFILGLSLVLAVLSNALAQNSLRLKIADQDSNPIPGATLQIKSLNILAISDEQGIGVLSSIPNGSFQIEIRFVGFETQQFERTFPLKTPEMETIILLPHEDEMEEIIVQSNRSSRVIQDLPIRVEVIAGEELAEKGNMKPGDIRMLLNESTGIQTQQTSATSYNSSIRIQGLDGKYT